MTSKREVIKSQKGDSASFSSPSALAPKLHLLPTSTSIFSDSSIIALSKPSTTLPLALQHQRQCLRGMSMSSGDRQSSQWAVNKSLIRPSALQRGSSKPPNLSVLKAECRQTRLPAPQDQSSSGSRSKICKHRKSEWQDPSSDWSCC